MNSLILKAVVRKTGKMELTKKLAIFVLSKIELCYDLNVSFFYHLNAYVNRQQWASRAAAAFTAFLLLKRMRQKKDQNGKFPFVYYNNNK